MSKQQVTEFLSDVKESEKLQEKIKDTLKIDGNDNNTSTDEVNKQIDQITVFAADHGYDFSADEYRAVLESVQKKDKAELSDKELERVAGGGADDLTFKDVAVSLLAFLACH